MHYDLLLSKADEFYRIVKELRIPFADDSLVKLHFETIKEYGSDRAAMTESEWEAKWDTDEGFERFYNARIVVNKLVDAVLECQDRSRRIFKDTLKKILAGSLTP